MHSWVGSFCYTINNNNITFPREVIAVSDIITLVEDLGNQIPDKSWMLYLLEIFNKEDIAIELNLICQFDSQNYFEAIFEGVNRYRFKKVLPLLGHSYLRQIIVSSQTNSIIYILVDQNINQTERYELSLYNIQDFEFEGKNHFTGIEWWNIIGDFLYPVRYNIEISQLAFGVSDDLSEPESIIYNPYSILVPNTEGSSKQYPISFHNVRIRENSICYNVVSGSCDDGLRFNY